MKSSDDFHVRLKNFQSIKDGDLTFPSGVTVVVGQSNSGKTAILRAIKANVLNPPRTQRFITHGEKNTSVLINYLGNSFEWTRNDSGCQYIINDETYKKLGSSDLFDYLDDNGFVVDEKGNLMNIEGENQILFPFDKSAQELFKLFENLLSVLQSSGVLKQFKVLEDSRNSELSELESDIFKMSNKVKAIKELEDVADLSKLKEFKNDISKHAEIIKNISEDIAEIKNNISIMKATRIQKHATVDNKLDDYLELLTDLKYVKDVIKLCKGFKPPEVDTNNKLDKYNELKDIINMSRLMKATGINNIPEVRQFDFNKYVELRKDINTLKNIKSKALDVKNSKLNVTKELEEIKEELSKVKTCPLCGHALEEE